MIWVFVIFQLLFDAVVITFLLAYLFRQKEENPSSASPQVWQEEILSTLAQLVEALNERVPQRASTLAAIHSREEHATVSRERGILPGERLLISSLAEKRERARGATLAE